MNEEREYQKKLKKEKERWQKKEKHENGITGANGTRDFTSLDKLKADIENKRSKVNELKDVFKSDLFEDTFMD